MALYSVNFNAYDRQRAAAYVAYMIVGSYFDRMKPSYTLGLCRLEYAQMKEEKKYESEERADAMMERLGDEFLGSISTLRCEVETRKEGDDLLLRFKTGGFEEVECTVGSRGRLEIKALPCAA